MLISLCSLLFIRRENGKFNRCAYIWLRCVCARKPKHCRARYGKLIYKLWWKWFLARLCSSPVCDRWQPFTNGFQFMSLAALFFHAYIFHEVIDHLLCESVNLTALIYTHIFHAFIFIYAHAVRAQHTRWVHTYLVWHVNFNGCRANSMLFSTFFSIIVVESNVSNVTRVVGKQKRQFQYICPPINRSANAYSTCAMCLLECCECVCVWNQALY